jgi:hypothetical protein
MALCTLAELEAFLQTDVDATAGALAIELATGVVVGYTGQNFEADTYTQALMIGSALEVKLPQRPVTAVTTVTVDGEDLVELDEYTWDGLSPYLTLEESPPVDVWTATVEYDAGYAAVPGLVKAVVLAVAARAYGNPHRVSSQSIDDYSVTYANDSAGLLPEEKRLLRRYRSSVGTVAPS